MQLMLMRCAGIAACVGLAAAPIGLSAADDRLVDAIRKNDRAAVAALIGAGADVNAADASGVTPLMYAGLLADTDVVGELLKGGAAVNARGASGATALLWSLRRTPTVQLLLARGAAVDAAAANGWTALSVAVRLGNVEAMRLLIAAGADTSSPVSRKLLLTAAYQAPDPAVHRLLRESGVVLTSLSEIAGPVLQRNRDDVATLRELLALGVNPREQLPTNTIVLPTFFLAARDGQLDAIRAFVERGMDPRHVGARGTTALTLAAGADRPNIAALQYLLDQGLDVNHADSDGRTALDWALTRGETEVSAFLRTAGGRTNAVPHTAPARVARPRSARAAIELAVSRLQPAGRAFTDRTKCTSCHNEYIPGIAVAIAKRHRLAVDEPLAAHSRAMTEENWSRRRDLVVLGETTPATGLPPGVGLGLLERLEAGLLSSSLTDVMVAALAGRQKPDGTWDDGEGIRPPLNGNLFASTALAVRALTAFAPAAYQAEIAQRVKRAGAFFLATPAMDTQDHAFRLLGLVWSQARRHEIERARLALTALQRKDGGWGQMPTLTSDAYATGQALYALNAAGIRADDAIYRRGAAYLLQTQLEDGTWFVRTRAFGVQPYFETGFPHGASQFISATATAWAVIALGNTL
jgi:ankyrin repeat protein